jgi:hypothetical protein
MSKLKDFYEEYKPEILVVATTMGACLLTAFYAMGVSDGKRFAAHGPCIEVGRKGADLLLAGRTLAVKVTGLPGQSGVGRDVLYRVLD